jgi:hypothetical protein
MPPNEANCVNLRLIGQMEAWSNTDENILPQGRKARALLAVLALSGATPLIAFNHWQQNIKRSFEMIEAPGAITSER